MFSSLFRRTAVVVALTAGATSLVAAGTVGTALGAGPHSTSLAIRTAHAAVKPGGTDTVSGNLRVAGQALPGKTVTLEARLAGDTAFLPIATAVSGPAGGVALKVTPAESTRYRWAFAGDGADNASLSGVATVKVRVPQHQATRLPASLSIRAAHPVVSIAGADAISGRLLSRRTPLRHKMVVLLSRTSSSAPWAFVRVKATGGNGGVAFGVKPVADTQYRLLFQGTVNFRSARSAVVRVAIRATALSIATSAAKVPSGSSAAVSGVLTDHGTAYAGQSVQLWGKPVGGKHTFAALASTTSGVDGSVSFTVTPTRAMRYYLYFPRTADAPAARS
ncbi:MAG TPA: hypothetical protein VHZ06_04980, partial [Marmoricola sp.]|nr:hypothetical protein [Marmoricola sp.]